METQAAPPAKLLIWHGPLSGTATATTHSSGGAGMRPAGPESAITLYPPSTAVRHLPAPSRRTPGRAHPARPRRRPGSSPAPPISARQETPVGGAVLAACAPPAWRSDWLFGRAAAQSEGALQRTPSLSQRGFLFRSGSLKPSVPAAGTARAAGERGGPGAAPSFPQHPAPARSPVAARNPTPSVLWLPWALSAHCFGWLP